MGSDNHGKDGIMREVPNDDHLWAALASGAQQMLTNGLGSLKVTSSGSALAFSGANVADLNLAFSWGDTDVVDSISKRPEDFLLLASPSMNAAISARAGECGIAMVDEPLPVWVGEMDNVNLPPSFGLARRATRAEMTAVNEVLAQAYGLDVAPLEFAFPESVADRIHVYLSAKGETSIAALMAIRTDDVVSLWSGGTIPPARNQGFFTDLLAYALSDQRNLGARYFTGITEAVASANVVERLGGVHHTDAYVWLRGTSVGELLQ